MGRGAIRKCAKMRSGRRVRSRGAEVFARNLRRDDVHTPGETNGDECDHAHRLG